MDHRVPWPLLLAEIEPFYPSSGRRGRPPVGVEHMAPHVPDPANSGLSDEATEDALYDSQSARGFVGVDLSRETAPDATSLPKFHRPLERNGLTKRMFEVINAYLAEQVIPALLGAARSRTQPAMTNF